MTKNNIIFISILVVVVVGVFMFFKSGFGLILIHPAQKEPFPPQITGEEARKAVLNTSYVVSEPTPPTPQQVKDPRSEIVYGADGKLDTSKWVEYRSEYGGFSVRAPKIFARIECGHGCDPKRDGEPFSYSLTNGFEADSGLHGMEIHILEKKNGATLDNLLSTYTGTLPTDDQLFNQKKVTLNGYPALQVDISTSPSSGKPVNVTFFYSPASSIRLRVVDLGNRFAVIVHTLAYNKPAIEQYNKSNPDGSVEPLDEKTLADIYQAILGSFQASPQTKS